MSRAKRRKATNPIRKAEAPVVAAARELANRAATRNSSLELVALTHPDTGEVGSVLVLAVGLERVRAVSRALPAIQRGDVPSPSSSSLRAPGLLWGLVVPISSALAGVAATLAFLAGAIQ